MEKIKGVRLYYDNSKDLYEGLIIENDNGVQNQVGQVFPAFRDKYGKLFASAPDMYEALTKLLNTGICDICYEDDCGGEFACTKGKYGEPCNCHETKRQAEEDCYKALAKAEGK